MKNLILIIASVLFLTSLCALPVETVLHVGLPQEIHRYASCKPFWDIGDYDHIRWQVLGMTWTALGALTAISCLASQKLS